MDENKPVVSEEMSFETVNGRTPDGRQTDAGQTPDAVHQTPDDGQSVITIAHPDISSDELKRASCFNSYNINVHLCQTSAQKTGYTRNNAYSPLNVQK